MGSDFIALLISLLCASTVNSMTEKQEEQILQYFRKLRAEVQESDRLPLIWDNSAKSIHDEGILKQYLSSQENLKDLSKYAELIHWDTIIPPLSVDTFDDNQYLSFIEGIGTFYAVFGIEFEDPGAGAGGSLKKKYPTYDADDKQYNVGECIGKGHFGRVLKAWNVHDPNKHFAMKTEELGANKQYLPQEYHIYKDLKDFHANSPERGSRKLPIPEVVENSLGVWNDSGNSYNAMIMELLGKDVSHLFRLCCNSISTKSIVVIIEQVVRALMLAHDAGYVHRDIKTGNLLVSKKLIKVGDWGLASKFVNKTGKYVSPEGEAVGTAPYKCIEMLMSKGNFQYIPRYDLQSLGYAMLFLRLGSTDSFYSEDLNEHIKLKNVDAEELCVNCPPELVQFVRDGRPKANEVPVIDAHIKNWILDYKPILENIEELKRKLKITEEAFEFDWDRKMFRLLQDPEVHMISYCTMKENDKLSNYLYVGKFYSEIFREMQNIRKGKRVVPFILDSKLTEEAKALAKNPDNGKKYQNGTIPFQVTVDSMQLKRLLEELKSRYSPEQTSSDDSDSEIVPEGEEGESSENVPEGKEGERSEKVPDFMNTLHDPTYIYINFGCSHKSVKRNGNTVDEFTFTIIMAPHLVEPEGEKEQHSSTDSDLMKVAYDNLSVNATLDAKGYFRDTSSVTMRFETDLADEDLVSRDILKAAIRSGKTALLLKHGSPDQLEPSRLGFAYRIDNIKNCTVVAVTMFRKLKFYHDVLETIQGLRGYGGSMPLILDQQVAEGDNQEASEKHSRNTLIAYRVPLSSESTSRFAINKDYLKAFSSDAIEQVSASISAMSSSIVMENSAVTTNQLTFDDAIYESAHLYISFEHSYNQADEQYSLMIKFGGEIIDLEETLAVNIDPLLKQVAKTNLFESKLTPESVRLAEIVIRQESSVTMFATAELTKEGVLTREKFESAIQACGTAIIRNDVVGAMDPSVLGYWYKIGKDWQKAVVSVTVPKRI